MPPPHEVARLDRITAATVTALNRLERESAVIAGWTWTVGDVAEAVWRELTDDDRATFGSAEYLHPVIVAGIRAEAATRWQRAERARKDRGDIV